MPLARRYLRPGCDARRHRLQRSAAPTRWPARKDRSADPPSHPGCVKSPMVGTAYRSPEPGAAPFVEVGQAWPGPDAAHHRGDEDDEPDPGPKAGTVKQILVENGQPVEYGEPLVIIE